MKKTLKNTIKLGLVVFFISAVNLAFAQGDGKADKHQINFKIPEVAYLDLEAKDNNLKNFTVEYTHSTEAGDPITFKDAPHDIWLNYSSILKDLGKPRHVVVKLDNEIPGITINVEAGNSASGFGTLGVSLGKITLSTTDQKIIEKIGSTYTITGPGYGHPLKYTFDINNSTYEKIVVGGVSTTVVYTLMDM